MNMVAQSARIHMMPPVLPWSLCVTVGGTYLLELGLELADAVVARGGQQLLGTPQPSR